MSDIQSEKNNNQKLENVIKKSLTFYVNTISNEMTIRSNLLGVVSIVAKLMVYTCSLRQDLIKEM